MRNCWCLALNLLTGCVPMQMQPEEHTAQVPASPFAEPKRALATRVNFPPATQETSHRVLLIKDQLVAKNPQIGIKPYAIAVGLGDPEVFHVGNTIYITEGLVRQCRTNEAVAAVLAYEMGRMVAQRESSVADDIRQPDRPLPIQLPIGGNSYGRESDPLHHIELARYEKERPKNTRKPVRPEPQNVARAILENAGFQRTELDGVLPVLQNAERFSVLENQFKGSQKQSDWKAP